MNKESVRGGATNWALGPLSAYHPYYLPSEVDFIVTKIKPGIKR
jgi:hypothetical protein